LIVFAFLLVLSGARGIDGGERPVIQHERVAHILFVNRSVNAA